MYFKLYCAILCAVIYHHSRYDRDRSNKNARRFWNQNIGSFPHIYFGSRRWIMDVQSWLITHNILRASAMFWYQSRRAFVFSVFRIAAYFVLIFLPNNWLQPCFQILSTHFQITFFLPSSIVHRRFYQIIPCVNLC